MRYAKTLCYAAAAAVVVSGCSGGSNTTAALPGNPSDNASTQFGATSARPDFADGSLRQAAAVGTNAYVSTVMNDSPVAYYRLNDVGAVLTDSGPNHLNGTIGQGVSHGVAPMTATGDSSLGFNGAAYDRTQFASAPLAAALQPTQAVTVEAWVRSNAVNTGGLIPVIAYGKQSQGPAYTIFVSPQNVFQVYMHTAQPGGINAEGYTQIKPGVVYHVVATYNGTTLALYLNGQLEASMNGTGALTYANLNSYDGLGVGGSLDKNRPEFNGSISEVSIYGRALPQSTIVSHFSAGAQPLVLTEKPRTTDNLVDIMGINTHLHYTDTIYATQWPRIKQLILNLGVRHIRDGILDTKFTAYYDRLEELGMAGVRSTDIAGSDATPALLTSFPARVPHSFEAYEPPNEPDVNGGPNWIANTQAFQKMMYAAVKSNPATANFRVLGPAVTNLQDYQALGDLSQYMDLGNFHLYPASYNPGTDGYGSKTQYGISGSIDFASNIARIVDGQQHWMAWTETGYNYAPGIAGNLPTDVGAKYLPRMFFEAFNRGMRRTFVYQLIDWEGSKSFQDGLVDQNFQPKAPYVAMKNLISILKDPSPLHATVPLAYSLSGDLANVHHTLMQRGDGTYALALWIETRSVVPGPRVADGPRITVPTQMVTIQVPAVPHTMSVQAFDNTGNVTTSTPATIGISTQVPITDSISIVNFHL